LYRLIVLLICFQLPLVSQDLPSTGSWAVIHSPSLTRENSQLLFISGEPPTQSVSTFHLFKDYNSVIMASFSMIGLGGNVANTLENGIGFSAIELNYPLSIKWISVGVNWLELNFHYYKLMPYERKYLTDNYVLETSQNGFVTERKPVEDVLLVHYKFSVQSTLAFVNDKGFVLGQLPPLILRPYCGIGASFNYVDDSYGFDGGPALGVNVFLRMGMDFSLRSLLKSSTRDVIPFLRVEFQTGFFPNYNLRLIPQLRTIQGGHFTYIKFALGFDKSN